MRQSEIPLNHLAASGGVTTALIQLGHAAKIQVWVTGRTEEKRALARKLGADQTFASGVYLPQQVDAVFDNVGAATRKHSMKNVRTGGTIVVSGATTGAKPEAMLRRVFVDSISVHGSYASTLQEFKSMLTFVTTRGIKPDRQRSPDGSGGRRFPPSLER